MTSIVTASAQAAPTGTGITFKPRTLLGLRAIYRNDTVGVLPRLLTLQAVEPVKTKGYSGAMRGSVKLQQGHLHPVTGVEWPKVMTTTSSLPEFLTLTEKMAFVDEYCLLLRNEVIVEHLNQGIVPQS